MNMALRLPAEHVYTVTPASVDDFAQCGWRYRATHLAKQNRVMRFEQPTYSLQLGKAVHETLAKINQKLLTDGGFPDPSVILAKLWNPSYFRTKEEEEEARYALLGMVEHYRAFLTHEALTVLAAERFTQTSRLHLHDGVQVVLRGKIDVLCQRPDGTVLCLDFKTGSVLPSGDDLAMRPSSTVYRCLAKLVCADAPAVLIGQLLLSTGINVTVDLEPEHVEAGKAVIRTMVTGLDAEPSLNSDVFQPKPGEYCAYCFAQAGCPLFLTDGEGDAF
jgi:hypothetical protein